MIGGRKFAVTVGAFVCGFAALGLHWVTGEQWVVYSQWVVGLYMAGNVGAAAATRITVGPAS